MEYHIIEYPNGVKAVLLQTHSPIVHTSLTIGAATRDENSNEYGFAHFIEHMLFKGTKKRKQYHINTLLDNVGGELNAYTTKEETVVHATTLKGDFVKAVDLICDVVFNSVFDSEQINLERTVIVDEINSYKDSPSELIYDQFEDLIFASSQLGHPILGTPKSLKSATSEKLINFINRTYNSDNMVFAVTGAITPRRFKQVCDRFIAPIPPSLRSFERAAPPLYCPTNIELNKKTYQRHYMVGNRAYSHYDNNRVPLALLSNILGGQSPSSILNQILREKNGLTYNVEASYTSFVDTGMFAIYFSCESDKFEKCISLLNREVENIKNNALSTAKLERYKRQLRGQLAISSENSENNILSSARSLLIYSEIDSMRQISQRIDSINSQSLLEVANQVLESNKLSSLTYL